MSSGFVTEAEINETKKKRQEEWEKVRKNDDPEEAPEEPYDGRCLYERLKEQKMKKDLEYEEAHKLKNLIRGLDDDEVQFLNLIEQKKLENDKVAELEVERELEDYRKKVAQIQNKTEKNNENGKIKTEKKIEKTKPSQKQLISGIIKKSDSLSKPDGIQEPSQNQSNKRKIDEVYKSKNEGASSNLLKKGALNCVGVLPGIGHYKESSDSEISSDSEEELICKETYDLCGRKREKRCDEE